MFAWKPPLQATAPLQQILLVLRAKIDYEFNYAPLSGDLSKK
jgi:hypothetical protein